MRFRIQDERRVGASRIRAKRERSHPSRWKASTPFPRAGSLQLPQPRPCATGRNATEMGQPLASSSNATPWRRTEGLVPPRGRQMDGPLIQSTQLQEGLLPTRSGLTRPRLKSFVCRGGGTRASDCASTVASSPTRRQRRPRRPSIQPTTAPKEAAPNVSETCSGPRRRSLRLRRRFRDRRGLARGGYRSSSPQPSFGDVCISSTWE